MKRRVQLLLICAACSSETRSMTSSTAAVETSPPTTASEATAASSSASPTTPVPPRTARATVEAMIAAGCKKDVEGFFDYVNRTKMKATLGEYMKRKGVKFTDAILNAAASKAMDEWEDEIKKGANGAVCLLMIESTEGDDVVILKRASGKFARATFEPGKHGLELVGYTPND